MGGKQGRIKEKSQQHTTLLNKLGVKNRREGVGEE